MEERDDGSLDPVTQRELRELAREHQPPAGLEERVVHQLRDERLLGSGASLLSSSPWMRAAAAVLLAALGFAAGAWWMRPAPAITAVDRGGPRFLLLLHETPVSQASSPERLHALIEEYKSWAADGARQGFLLDGEKLKDARYLLPETSGASGARAEGTEGPIGGYFVIRAGDYEEALRLARTCPHLRHGGRIEVREIDPV